MDTKKQKNKEMLEKMSLKEGILIYTCISLFLIMCVVPFVMLLSASFSDSDMVNEFGAKLWPQKPTIAAFSAVFAYPEMIFRSYLVSIVVTVGGAALNMMLCLPVAYATSKRDYSFRNAVSVFFVFTIMFSGGFVPSYILYRNYLKIYDTLWVLILPNGVIVGYMIYLRTFFAGLPQELFESADIDGSNELVSMLKIGIPLIVPGIASVLFYIVLFYWNDSQMALLYTESDALIPIALYVTRLQNYIEFLKFSELYGIDSGTKIPSATLVFATAVITTAPMLFVFSMFQKYFVRGLTSGGVKG